MRHSTAKQFLLVAGEPILGLTLRIFESSPAIDEIVLVVPEAEIAFVRGMTERGHAKKIGGIVSGGSQRQDSVRRGLDAADRAHDLVVVHDAVRPFLAQELLASVIDAARGFGAATLGVPVKDTVKETDREGWIVGTLDRSRLWLTQTPQAFHRDVLNRAFTAAATEGFYGTDDAMLVERIGIPVRMVPGSAENIKITTPEDLLIAETFLRRRRRKSECGD